MLPDKLLFFLEFQKEHVILGRPIRHYCEGVLKNHLPPSVFIKAIRKDTAWSRSHLMLNMIKGASCGS